MRSIVVRLSLLTLVLFCVAFVTPAIMRAQDTKPLPESPPSENPKPEPPSPPAESPRNDPPPSSPAEAPRPEPPPSAPSEAPRSEPPSSPPAEAPRSNPAPNSGASPNNDGGSARGNNGNRRNDGDSARGNNDNRRNDNDRRTNEDGGRARGSMSGDGSGNRRDRVIETESGEIVAPGRARGNSGTPERGNPGGNLGSNPTTRGGNSTGNHGDRHRDRDGDRDRDRWRDRHRDGRDHRHYRGDECYQVPTYDDTVSYSAASYPDYDRDDSLSAYDRGYNDGLYTGANDGRRGQTYDPERSHFYRSATDGYRSAKGSQITYEMAYRDGFLHGYREGYENWQRYFVGGVFRR